MNAPMTMPQPPKPGGVDPILSRIKSAADYRNTWLRVFLYGGTRTGKTQQAALFPRPFLISPPNENGYQTVRGRDVPYFVPGEHDPLMTKREMEGLLQRFHYDLTALNVAADGGAAWRAKWGDTIIWDSVAHYADAVVSELTVERDKMGRPILDSHTGAMQHDQSNKQTWGHLRTHLMNVRDILFRLPCHIVITTLDATTTDDNGNVTWQGPRVPGAAGDLLPSSCELVGFVDMLHGKYVVHFQKVGKAEAGTRIPGMKQQTFGVGLEPGQTLYDQLVPFVMGGAR